MRLVVAQNINWDKCRQDRVGCGPLQCADSSSWCRFSAESPVWETCIAPEPLTAFFRVLAVTFVTPALKERCEFDYSSS